MAPAGVMNIDVCILSMNIDSMSSPSRMNHWMLISGLGSHHSVVSAVGGLHWAAAVKRSHLQQLKLSRLVLPSVCAMACSDGLLHSQPGVMNYAYGLTSSLNQRLQAAHASATSHTQGTASPLSPYHALFHRPVITNFCDSLLLHGTFDQVHLFAVQYSSECVLVNDTMTLLEPCVVSA